LKKKMDLVLIELVSVALFAVVCVFNFEVLLFAVFAVLIKSNKENIVQ